MQLAFHVGVHGSDEDRIPQWLALNADLLASRHVEVPPREVEEPILNEAIASLKGGTASAQLEELVCDALLDHEDTGRIVISRASLLGRPRRALDGDGLLAQAGERMRALANIFPSAQCTFFLALKNPATYLADILDRVARAADGPDLATDPARIRWIDSVQRMQRALGGAHLVIWCNEDTPLILPEIMRRMTGLEGHGPLPGDMAAAERILTADGVAALQARLAAAGALDTAARRRLTEAVLADMHDPEALRLSIAHPGWTQEVIDRMTADYDADVAAIAALPGVEFLTP